MGAELKPVAQGSQRKRPQVANLPDKTFFPQLSRDKRKRPALGRACNAPRSFHFLSRSLSCERVKTKMSTELQHDVSPLEPEVVSTEMISEAVETCFATMDEGLERALEIATPDDIIAIRDDGDDPADTFEVETAEEVSLKNGVYHEIKRKLNERYGIPLPEIAFIHEAGRQQSTGTRPTAGDHRRADRGEQRRTGLVELRGRSNRSGHYRSSDQRCWHKQRFDCRQSRHAP